MSKLREGTVLLWRYHKLKPWYRDWVSKAIAYFTGYPYVHVAIFFDGRSWESTLYRKGRKIHHGAVESPGIEGINQTTPDELWEPKKQLTVSERKLLSAFLIYTVQKRMPYNFLKIICIPLIWPTRWLWKLIRWVPFDHRMYGEICSVYVDEAYKFIGRDLFPEHYEGYTVPGMFPDSKLLRKVKE